MVESNAPAGDVAVDARDGAAIASNAPAWSRSSRSSAGDVTWPVMVESNAAGDVAVDGDPLVTAPATW